MCISKNFLKTRPSCKVKFELAPEDVHEASEVFLVGDFNDWNIDSHPKKKRKDGTHALEIELPLGQDYQFRYRMDNGTWANDPQADAFVPCPFANTENFLVKV